jgi:hypothetical protein
MSAAGAAAAARLALNPISSTSRRQRQLQRAQTLPRWLSGLWGSVTQNSRQPVAGPVTKRQLLGLYAEVLGKALGVLGAVARGSEAHVVTSIKHMDAVRQCVGPDAEETALAEGLCGRAHAARWVQIEALGQPFGTRHWGSHVGCGGRWGC